MDCSNYIKEFIFCKLSTKFPPIFLLARLAPNMYIQYNLKFTCANVEGKWFQGTKWRVL